MADSAHVAIVKEGKEAFQIWRDQHPGTVLDLEGSNLSARNLDAYDLSGAILRRADLTAANLPNVTLEGADLTGAICVNAIFNQVDLRSTKYEGATFQGASFLNAKLPVGLLRQNCRGAKFLENDLSAADLSGGDFSECSFDKVRLSGARLHGATLRSAQFLTCDLQGADLSGVDGEGAKFGYSNLTGACLGNATLTGADFTSVDLARADISRADFYEAILDKARMRQIRGAPKARNLLTTRISAQSPVQYFEDVVLSHCDRWLDWQMIRIVGRLPLFGASWSALIAIPLFFYAWEIYNDHVRLIRGWAEQARSSTGTIENHMAQMVLQKLNPLPPPALSEWLLVSTIFLAVGASVYATACPSRVKEFSRDQWTHQLGLSVVHYMAAAWSRKPFRLIAVAFYVPGGLGALYVLGSKLWYVPKLLLSNQTWPL